MTDFGHYCASCGQGYDGGHVCDLDPDLDPNLDPEIQVLVTGIHFHRNGTAGEPFHAVSFITFDDDANARELVAVVSRGICAVITPGDINETWRGDYMEPLLRDAIDQWEAKWQAIEKGQQ